MNFTLEMILSLKKKKKRGKRTSKSDGGISGDALFGVKCASTDVWGGKRAAVATLRLEIDTNDSVIVAERPRILSVRLVLFV